LCGWCSLTIRGSDGLPISSRAVNVAWFGKEILFCGERSVKLLKSGAVAVITGHSKGDSDGSQSYLKLCQPIGICVEFDRNIHVTDSGSGAFKLINRRLTGIAEFHGKLQVLVKAFNIHSKKAQLENHRSRLMKQLLWWMRCWNTEGKRTTVHGKRNH